MAAGRRVPHLQVLTGNVAAMRAVQSFQVLTEGEISIRTAHIVFIISSLELVPEVQNSGVMTTQNVSDSLYTRCLKRQRQRCYENAPGAKAEQSINEQRKSRQDWQALASNGRPAIKQEKAKQEEARQERVKQVWQSIALNGNPAKANRCKSDFHLVSGLMSEGDSLI